MSSRQSRARKVAAALLLAVSIAIVAIVGPGVFDRVVHPTRYATSGHALLAPGMYAAAARTRAGTDARIASLDLPIGNAPVVVSIWPSTEVYLDPPTARVLDVARTGETAVTRPILGAQPIGSVIARARPYAGGGGLRRIEWPTERSPDWTLRFCKKGAVKVADDSGTARPAPMRRPSGATALAARLPDLGASHLAVRVAILVGALAAAIVLLLALIRSARTGARCP